MTYFPDTILLLHSLPGLRLLPSSKQLAPIPQRNGHAFDGDHGCGGIIPFVEQPIEIFRVRSGGRCRYIGLNILDRFMGHREQQRFFRVRILPVPLSRSVCIVLLQSTSFGWCGLWIYHLPIHVIPRVCNELSCNLPQSAYDRGICMDVMMMNKVNIGARPRGRWSYDPSHQWSCRNHLICGQREGIGSRVRR